MCFHPQKSDLGANNRTLAVGHVAKLSVKTEVSQTTPPHTRNFWKHSGTFQDKILGHFRARGGAKGAQSVLKMLLLLMVFFGDLPCVLTRTREGSSGIVNHFCSSKLCGIVMNPGM